MVVASVDVRKWLTDERRNNVDFKAGTVFTIPLGMLAKPCFPLLPSSDMVAICDILDRLNDNL